MKAEIKKEYSINQQMFFYYIYIDGDFKTSSCTIEEAQGKLLAIKESILNPIKEEIIHTEEF